MQLDLDGSGWDKKMADFLELKERLQTEMQDAILAQKQFEADIKKVTINEQAIKGLKLPTSVDSLPAAEHLCGSW